MRSKDLNNLLNLIHVMDKVDQKILSLLQKNDKISYTKLAKYLNLAASTVHNRVKNMEKKGIIKQYSAIINPDKVGYNARALLGITVNPEKMKDIAQKLATYEEVQLVAVSTGDHDIVVQIIAENEKTLWRFINTKIKSIDGIKSRMDVSSFIDVYKNTHIVGFDHNDIYLLES